METPAFAHALRKVWKRSGLRQEEFAERLAYKRSTVANMMRGIHLPPLEFLNKVEESFPRARSELELLLRREREQRNRHAPMWEAAGIDLSGTWYAIWETTVEGELNVNTEVLRIEQAGNHVILRNEAVSPENPIGGFLWRGDCTLHDNAFLMGMYTAIDPNDRQRGVMFFDIHRSGQFMVGRWVGCTYDTDLYDGLTVLAREPELARVRFDKALGDTRDDRRS